MEKIKNILNNTLQIINNFIKAILRNNKTQMLVNEDYYIYKMSNRQILDEYQAEVTNLEAVEEAIFLVGDMELPIGSFKINGNNIEIDEEVTITPDGEMYMRGKPICKNSQVKEEIARQIKQNGDVTQTIRVDEDGNVIKTNPEIYRNESYNDEARKRTEKVSEYYRNEEQTERRQEHTQENEQEQEDERYIH